MFGDTRHDGWITLGLLAAAGAAGALAWKQKPVLGTIAGMLAVVALRKPLNWGA